MSDVLIATPTLAPSQSAISVAARPHPFSTARIDLEVPVGLTCQAILEQAVPDAFARAHAAVAIDGVLVSPRMLPRVRPRAGRRVTITIVPGDTDGGKNPFAMVLMLAVVVAAAAVTYGVGSLFTTPWIGAAIGAGAGALVAAGGFMAINALIPPSSQKHSEQTAAKTSPTIAGARNEIRPWGVIPRVLGRHRVFPPFGAHPYTELVGEDQYLRLLFVLGYGPLALTDLKIGDTPLEDFAEVEYEIREGFPGEPPITLYSGDVDEQGLAVDLADGLAEGTGLTGDWYTRTSAEDADELSVDLTWLKGLGQMDEGDRDPRTAEIHVEYAPTGTSAWARVTEPFKFLEFEVDYTTGQLGNKGSFGGSLRGAAGLQDGVYTLVCTQAAAGEDPCLFEVTAPDASTLSDLIVGTPYEDEFAGLLEQGPEPFAVDDTLWITVKYDADASILISDRLSVTPLRAGLRWAVARGQYDVRVRQVGEIGHGSDPNEWTMTEATWTALRTIRHSDPAPMDGLCKVAMRIKATGQLTGVVDTFNCVAQSILPDWHATAGAWVERATNNPASLMRAVLQGPGNARPVGDARIDLTALQAFHTWCVSKGYAFNRVLDYETSVREALRDVCAAGRATPALVDGSRWSVVIDQPQSVPRAHFTPRNSWSFTAEKVFVDRPHAWRIPLQDEDQDYQADEVIVYDDGYDATTATRFETLELAGVTRKAQAWALGRYHLAVLRLRPETYTLSTDLEHLVVTRGDLVRVSYDVPLWGTIAGRITALVTSGTDTTALVIDERLTMTAGPAYSVLVRLADGTEQVHPLTTTLGEVSTLVLTTPVATASGPQVGDLVMVGETGEETVDLLVRAIRPGPDLTAQLVCVDAAPGVYTADTAEIPPFDPSITTPVELRVPPVPEVVRLTSDGGPVAATAEGGVSCRATITYRVPLSAGLEGARVQAEVRRQLATQPWTPLLPQAADGRQLVVSPLEAGQTYEIRLRTVSRHGIASAWVTVWDIVIPLPLAVSLYTLTPITGGYAAALVVAEQPPVLVNQTVYAQVLDREVFAAGPGSEGILTALAGDVASGEIDVVTCNVTSKDFYWGEVSLGGEQKTAWTSKKTGTYQGAAAVFDGTDLQVGVEEASGTPKLQYTRVTTGGTVSVDPFTDVKSTGKRPYLVLAGTTLHWLYIENDGLTVKHCTTSLTGGSISSSATILTVPSNNSYLAGPPVAACVDADGNLHVFAARYNVITFLLAIDYVKIAPDGTVLRTIASVLPCPTTRHSTILGGTPRLTWARGGLIYVVTEWWLSSATPNQELFLSIMRASGQIEQAQRPLATLDSTYAAGGALHDEQMDAFYLWIQVSGSPYKNRVLRFARSNR